MKTIDPTNTLGFGRTQEFAMATKLTSLSAAVAALLYSNSALAQSPAVDPCSDQAYNACREKAADATQAQTCEDQKLKCEKTECISDLKRDDFDKDQLEELCSAPPPEPKKPEPKKPKEPKEPPKEPKKDPPKEPKKDPPKDPNLDINVYVDISEVELSEAGMAKLAKKLSKWKLRGADKAELELRMQRAVKAAAWKTKLKLTVNLWGGPGLDGKQFTSELGIAGGHLGLHILVHPFVYLKVGVGGAASFGGPTFVDHHPRPAFYGEAGVGGYLNEGNVRAFVEAQFNLVNLAPGGGGGIGAEFLANKDNGFRVAVFGDAMGLVNPGNREGRDNPASIRAFVPRFMVGYVHSF